MSVLKMIILLYPPPVLQQLLTPLAPGLVLWFCKNSPSAYFATKTTKSEKEVFDEQIAKFIYATNSSFRIVEHEEFIRLIQLLRHGYSPPSRFDISGKSLDVVHEKCLESSEEMLKDKTVCMTFGGWSNVHNEPVICATVTTRPISC